MYKFFSSLAIEWVSKACGWVWKNMAYTLRSVDSKEMESQVAMSKDVTNKYGF